MMDIMLTAITTVSLDLWKKNQWEFKKKQIANLHFKMDKVTANHHKRLSMQTLIKINKFKNFH